MSVENILLLLKIIGWGVAVLAFISVNALWLIYMERKVSAHIQLRLGPMEVGWHGAFQTVNDTLKLLGKELITPRRADKWVFVLAPMLAMFPAVLIFIVIPFGEGWVVRDLNIGILYLFALSAFSVIAIFMGGYSSNNKYSMLGAIRSVSQNFAYEVPLLLSVLGVIMYCGTLSLSEIVRAQEGMWFVCYQPLAFLIFFIATLAETNRAPFDIPEGESEIIGGFHTEYTGMRFAMFFLGEYTQMFIVAAAGTVLFLGGWHGPLLPGPCWFLIKVYLWIFLVMWIRWTFPRVRVDQLLNFGWKYLIPLALANLIATGVFLKL